MPSLTDLIPGVKEAKWIIAGVGLTAFAVPTIGLIITRHTLHFEKMEFAKVKRIADNSMAAQRITLHSLDTVMAIVRSDNAQFDKLGQAYANSQKQAVADAQKLSDARKADATRIETLKALAGQKSPDGSCKVSTALIENVKGL